METVNHLGFIAAAYGAAGVVVVALIAWVIFDYRAQRRMLADLEKRGFSRRPGSRPVRAEPAINQEKQGA